MSLLVAGCHTPHVPSTSFPNKLPNNVPERPTQYPVNALVCQHPEQYNNLVVGDGHCVSLIKQCSHAPNTRFWRPGEAVLGKSLPYGTIIATFRHGRYPNKTGYHAAIYINQDESGIWVWDQWQGKPVHKRLIRWNNTSGTASNNANAYRVVKID